jgi:hypothetical protein
MPDTLARLVHDWQSFYLLLGSAAASLVGLMFVALSIGSRLFTQRNVSALRAFVTPSVMHFVYVLVTAGVVLIPSQTRTSLGILLVVGGLVSFTYLLLAIPVMRGSPEIDRHDWAWYLCVPLLCYLLLVGSGIGLLLRIDEALNGVALASIALLITGIRNSWDLVIYMILRQSESPPPERAADRLGAASGEAAALRQVDAMAPAPRARENEPTSLALPAPQQADVGDLIQGEGWDPGDFTWAIQPSRFALIGPLVSALVHRPTGGFFRFEFKDPSGQNRVSLFTPGEEGRETTKTAASWEDQLEHIRLWLKYLRQHRR